MQRHGGDITRKGHTAGGIQSRALALLHFGTLITDLSANRSRPEFLEGRYQMPWNSII